ncbi:MAG: hypothetical protein U1F14_16860, partial [Steroidobacteraceae bacterium]
AADAPFQVHHHHVPRHTCPLSGPAEAAGWIILYRVSPGQFRTDWPVARTGIHRLARILFGNPGRRYPLLASTRGQCGERR